ncbi:hypothetical protein [Geomesophilobacter sediminis]|uniref:Uncharacterized protein n=1 Tax=Geomesophilobacter sediminis TaxID=2798584 RepID=A0A8J7IRD9_9BACT|nr:hypothetical protein [Geomesophilobacter sediminis]MBJ6725449.1 hypothetical protein [Geomesophilobacter sediminis]
MRKFLHSLEKGEEWNTYLVCGREWEGFGYSEWDNLYSDGESGRIRVGLDRTGRFYWELTVELVDDPERPVYCTYLGHAASVEEACEAAVAYAPETVTLEYFGTSFTCYGNPRKDNSKLWTFVVDGEKAEVLGPFKSINGEGENFTWYHKWKPAELLLEGFCDPFGELKGKAPTMREAMIAAVDAPDRFKRACV